MQKTQTILMFFLFFLSISLSCGIETFLEPEYLNPPYNLKVFPGNEEIIVKFYSNNTEKNFDGFNIYISKNASVKNQTGITPIPNQNNGSIPTISLSSKDINPEDPIKVTIKRDVNGNPLENGIRYYVIARAHSIKNFISQPSNEDYTTPRLENTNNVIIYENEGFNFYTQDKSSPFNFIFKMINTNAYIKAQANNSLQSLGFFMDWREIKTAPNDGYVNSSSPILIKPGYVIIVKTDDERYGKIQIKDINTDAQIPYIKIIWAFQANYNNKDI